MQMFKLAFLIAPLLSITGVVASSDSADIVVPFTARSNVAAVQSAQNTGETRLFSQNTVGDIIQTCVSGPYTTGHTGTGTSCGAFALNGVIAPANETAMGTPIAAVDLTTSGFGDIRIYFFSPDNVLSEYIWQASLVSLRGGPTCSDCITTQGFVGVEGSQVLYAMGSSETSRMVRVGFVSAGSPQTISEVVFDGTTWQIAGLPN